MIKAARGPWVLWGCCLMSCSRAVSGDSLSVQAVPCLCLSPELSQPAFVLPSTLQPQGSALRVCLSQGQHSSQGLKLCFILPRTTVMEVTHCAGDHPTVLLPHCNFCMQNVGLCFDLAEKPVRLPLHEAVRCFAAVNHLLRLFLL